MHLLYLDDYHLGDPLFAQRLADLLGRGGGPGPWLLVHGSGDAERLLEAEGLFVERRAGVLQVGSAREAALVDRALRETTGGLVGRLTDAGVPAVGFQGADRGLLRHEAGGEVTTGKAGWLLEIVRRGVVPVVSAVALGPAGEAVPVPPGGAALALARVFPGGTVTVVFFTRDDRPGVAVGGALAGHLALDALPEGAVPDPDAVRTVVRGGQAALLSSIVGLLGGEEPQGTHILP